mmetsp:Transcript_5398/g.17886  ORF Transcript_5398/g.17886 Transcript_5398/m.17886 type:complete len:308 (+) Transcript_5398:253-1176(+)
MAPLSRLPPSSRLRHRLRHRRPACQRPASRLRRSAPPLPLRRRRQRRRVRREEWLLERVRRCEALVRLVLEAACGTCLGHVMDVSRTWSCSYSRQPSSSSYSRCSSRAPPGGSSSPPPPRLASRGPKRTSRRRGCDRTCASDRRSCARSGQRSAPCRTFFSIERERSAAARSMCGGSEPSSRSISARCSTSSCVRKSSSPVHSSARMQPMLHTSTAWLQPKPSVTSGGRYCRVHTIEPPVRSSRQVAPPKSTSRTADAVGISPAGSAVEAKSTFSSLRSVCVRPSRCRCDSARKQSAPMAATRGSEK